MNYQETLSWLYNQLPFYQKTGSFAYKKDIDHVVKFFDKHGKDYLTFDSIHVGGTNGKGSVSHMLSSVFQESGFKVGLFTSPHLLDFRERIKINGIKIDKDFVVGFVDSHMQDFINFKMSFFEMNVAMAFNYFKNKNVDIAIIEVGLGGKLDATNVLTPKLSIITNISIDHTHLLGGTLESIAKEKGGIIKKNTPVLIGEKNKKISIFSDLAQNLNSELFYAKEYVYQSDLKGDVQSKNINTCVAAFSILNNNGFNIYEKNIVKGLKNVVKNTGFLGRWHTISTHPLVICDVAHNTSAIRLVFKQLSTYNQNKKVIIGFSKDKDLELIISSLPRCYEYYLCGSKHPRIIHPKKISHLLEKQNLSYQTYDCVVDAYDDWRKENIDNSLLIITGSTFIVSDILKYLDKV